MLPPRRPAPMLPVVFWAALALTGPDLLLGEWMRSRQLRAAFETLTKKPDDPKALARWKNGVIIADCLAEAIILYGFLLHLLGGTPKEVIPFFVIGAVALLWWWPRRP